MPSGNPFRIVERESKALNKKCDKLIETLYDSIRTFFNARSDDVVFARMPLEPVQSLCARAIVFEKLWLQGEKRRDTSWYREYFRGRLRQRRRRGFLGAVHTGAMEPRGDFEQALRTS